MLRSRHLPVPLALAVLLTASPGLAATGCEDLWFTRNLIMDRAGYCFGSPLGKALFDNGDCVGTDVEPDVSLKADLAEIQRQEKDAGCKVDTQRTSIDLKDLAIRKRLVDLPIHEEFPGKCVGWTGPPKPLHSAHHPESPVIGEIAPGKDVEFFHMPVGEWTYVAVVEPGEGPLVSAGWYRFNNEEAPCASFYP